MSRLRIAAALLLFIAATLHAHAAAPAAAAPVPGDRWLEMDLYWFDPTDVARSADGFWKRYGPLYRGVAGYKGIVLNIGFTADYVLSYRGDAAQEIPLPKAGEQEVGRAARPARGRHRAASAGLA